ncbi:hypothetical protein [Acinetobacter bereziniae]|uniref:hypothetical protein n=1 Tax=Acinetobacter bereziniae TaxID=106648 RepID=UPI001250C5B2|nr:hypothetical protein [Acinetobacter bereziniae]
MNMLATMNQNALLPQAETAANVLAAQAKAQVEARYMMAMHRPRNWEEVRQNLKKECERPSFANNPSTFYKKPVGGTSITGLGIRFAEVAVRCMTNVLVETTMIFEDSQKEIHRVSVTDLESNTTYPQDIKINKTVERKNKNGRTVISERMNSYNELIYEVEATEDEMLNKRGSAISKTIRNLALRIIPGDIQDEMEQIILRVRNSGVKDDPELHKKQIIDSFANIGVKVSGLSAYLGCSVDQCSPSQIEDLRQIFAAIKTGETTWQSVISSKEEADIEAGTKTKSNDINAVNQKIKEQTA